MHKLGFFFALLSCIAVVLAQDETSRSCKDVSRQTCNGFQQCCSRRCAGPHQTTCTESSGRISQASCQCEGSGRFPKIRRNQIDAQNEEDRKTWLPFRVLYLPNDGIDPADLKALRGAFDYANEKFQRIMKGPRMHEIRKEQSICGFPEQCANVFVPPEFLLPCDDEPQKPPSDRVKQYNADGYGVVIYVAVNKYTVNSTGCKRGEFAYAANCEHNPVTRRRTHGVVVFCWRPSNMPRHHLHDVLLHETLHVVAAEFTGENSKLYNPFFEERDDNERFYKAENHTWRRVKRQWKTASGVEEKVRYLSILPTVMKAAKEHFKCDSIEGAELQGGRDPAHWSERLFADELMSPAGAGGNKLSVFTLGVMQDSGWYEVDMSAADPLTVSPPDKDHGCDVARKSCHEIVEEAAKDKKKVQLIAPYCDSSTNDPVLTPLCSKDGAITLTCQGASRPFQDGCDILQPNITDASFYTDAVCELANLRKAAEDLQFGPMGLAPGSGTRCVTFYNFHKKIGKTSLHPICMQSECHDGKILFKFNQNGCQIECPPGSSNKLHTFKRSTACHDNIVEELEYICPDMDYFSCPHKISPTTSGSPPNTVELASMGLLVSELDSLDHHNLKTNAGSA